MLVNVSLKSKEKQCGTLAVRDYEKALQAFLVSRGLAGDFQGFIRKGRGKGSSRRHQQGVIPRLVKSDAIEFFVQPGNNETCCMILLRPPKELVTQEVFKLITAKPADEDDQAGADAPDREPEGAVPPADEAEARKLDTAAILDDPDKLSYLLESLYELLEKDSEREFVTALFRDHLIKFEVINPDTNLRQVGQLAKAMAARSLLVRKGSGLYQLTSQAIGIIQPASAELQPVEDPGDLAALLKFVDRIKSLKKERIEVENRHKAVVEEVGALEGQRTDLEGRIAERRQEQEALALRFQELQLQLADPKVKERVEKLQSLLDELKQ